MLQNKQRLGTETPLIQNEIKICSPLKFEAECWWSKECPQPSHKQTANELCVNWGGTESESEGPITSLPSFCRPFSQVHRSTAVIISIQWVPSLLSPCNCLSLSAPLYCGQEHWMWEMEGRLSQRWTRCSPCITDCIRCESAGRSIKLIKCEF